MLNQVTVCLSFCKFKVGAILFFTGYNVITIRDSSHREVFIVMILLKNFLTSEEKTPIISL
jgi:hypothetical protein